MKTTPVHDIEKTANVEPLERRRSLKILIQREKLRRLPSHPLHTNLAQPTKNHLKRQSLNHQYKELSRTHQDIVDVPIELLTDPAWKPDRETDIQMFLSVPGITSKEQLPGELRNLTLALIADRFPHTAWTHVYTDGSAEEVMKNGGSGVYIRYEYSDGDTTSLSVPGGLQCSNYRAEILAISTVAEHLLERRKKMGNIAIFTDSLSTLQALNSADPDQMIQGLHSSLAKLTAQFTVSLQWVPAHVGLTGNEKADLQKSAVRLRRHRILSPTERPRHFSTLGIMETGRNKTVDIRHTLTQFGDWSGPSRPLSSACAQGIVV